MNKSAIQELAFKNTFSVLFAVVILIYLSAIVFVISLQFTNIFLWKRRNQRTEKTTLYPQELPWLTFVKRPMSNFCLPLWCPRASSSLLTENYSKKEKNTDVQVSTESKVGCFFLFLVLATQKSETILKTLMTTKSTTRIPLVVNEDNLWL